MVETGLSATTSQMQDGAETFAVTVLHAQQPSLADLPCHWALVLRQLAETRALQPCFNEDSELSLSDEFK